MLSIGKLDLLVFQLELFKSKKKRVANQIKPSKSRNFDKSSSCNFYANPLRVEFSDMCKEKIKVTKIHFSVLESRC